MPVSAISSSTGPHRHGPVSARLRLVKLSANAEGRHDPCLTRTSSISRWTSRLRRGALLLIAT